MECARAAQGGRSEASSPSAAPHRSTRPRRLNRRLSTPTDWCKHHNVLYTVWREPNLDFFSWIQVKVIKQKSPCCNIHDNWCCFHCFDLSLKSENMIKKNTIKVKYYYIINISLIDRTMLIISCARPYLSLKQVSYLKTAGEYESGFVHTQHQRINGY